ncbi:MAG: hypothetical protein APF80_08290 [Alphaproteobacteria bacterium BRH_c36]|nr:MAG: hypothetical protein APF80_08290 [Alphaproteobacteria bacterium BRH_c36]
MVHETVPKVELHCHLIGTLNAPLLREIDLAGERILVRPENVQPVGFGEGPQGFADWLVRVEPYKSAGWRDYLPVLEAHMERLVQQGVVYAEMMISPMMFARDTGALVEEFAEFQERVRSRERGVLQVEFLFLVPRSLPDEFIDKDIARCIALAKTGGICGISIAGLERDCPASRFERMFGVLKDHGLGIEIHAGELGGPEEIFEALDVGRADRIGHGVAAFRDERLVERLCTENVHIEFCPTSNLKMGAARDIASHPIGLARDLNMNFSINTDDPGSFDCTMNSEFALIESEFGFGKVDFQAVARNSLAARFQRNLRYDIQIPENFQAGAVEAILV